LGGRQGKKNGERGGKDNCSHEVATLTYGENKREKHVGGKGRGNKKGKEKRREKKKEEKKNTRGRRRRGVIRQEKNLLIT